MLEAVTEVDLVAARARHAAWLQSTRPTFLSPQEAQERGAVSIHGLRHPLLLEVRRCAGPCDSRQEVEVNRGAPALC